MGKLVEPKVYLIGEPVIYMDGLKQYLKDTNQQSFLEQITEAKQQGRSDPEILCSFFAKACYASLTTEKNANISKVRSITDNLKGTFNAGHGSVFEHVSWNFMITNCSRVFTHELVRHRVGTAFSQTSGRYVRPIDDEGNGILDLVFDPILELVQQEMEDAVVELERRYSAMVEKMGLNDMKDFTKKKKITSALRRILPNGQSNEMGFSLNLRTLRQLVTIRTARFAEWEIRKVFYQIYEIIKETHPMVFYGATEEMYDGIPEVGGMKLQPWEKSLSEYTDSELSAELHSRNN